MPTEKLQTTVGGLQAALALLQAFLFFWITQMATERREMEKRINGLAETVSAHNTRLTEGGFDAQAGMQITDRLGRLEAKVSGLPPKQIEHNRIEILKIRDRLAGIPR